MRKWMGKGEKKGKTRHCAGQPATQANSASYPKQNVRWVPAKVWWYSEAGSKCRMAHSIPNIITKTNFFPSAFYITHCAIPHFTHSRFTECLEILHQSYLRCQPYRRTVTNQHISDCRPVIQNSTLCLHALNSKYRVAQKSLRLTVYLKPNIDVEQTHCVARVPCHTGMVAPHTHVNQSLDLP